MLWMVQRVFFGPLTHRENQRLQDLNGRELAHRAALRGAGAGDGPAAAALPRPAADRPPSATSPGRQRGPRRAARADEDQLPTEAAGARQDAAAPLSRAGAPPLPAGTSRAQQLGPMLTMNLPTHHRRPTSCRCWPGADPQRRGHACCCSPRCSSPRPSRSLPGAADRRDDRAGRRGRRGAAAFSSAARRCSSASRCSTRSPACCRSWSASGAGALGRCSRRPSCTRPQRRARRVLRADALRRRRDEPARRSPTSSSPSSSTSRCCRSPPTR